MIVSLNPGTILLLFGTCLSSVVFQSFRQHIVLNKVAGRPVPFFRWLSLSSQGSMLNYLFPQVGLLHRSAVLKSEYGVSHTTFLTTLVAFNWLDLLITIGISLAVIVISAPNLALAGFRATTFLLVLAVVTVAGPFLARPAVGFVRRRLRYFENLQLRLASLLHVTLSSAHDTVYLAKICASGLVMFALSILLLHSAFSSLSLHVSWGNLALLSVVLRVCNMVVIVPGNLGVRELAMGLVGSAAGIDMAHMLLVALITRVAAVLVVIVMATSTRLHELVRTRPGA